MISNRVFVLTRDTTGLTTQLNDSETSELRDGVISGETGSAATMKIIGCDVV